ncbi:MAG: hypothetical protein CMH41_09070 [Micrococcales bacterium]|nr:hypothetical protein [Micrococcales bacterium]
MPDSQEQSRQNDDVQLLNSLKRSAPAKSEVAQQFLTRYQRFSRPLIITSALIPLIFTQENSGRVGEIIAIASWVVFLVDLSIQMRFRVRYLKSWVGILDLSIVIVTSPWYLLPGVDGGGIVVLARLARLARLLVIAKGAQHIFARLGRAAIIAVTAVLLLAFVAYEAENGANPEGIVNPEFASYGDSVWWGYVTLTTVGYGDIVPETVTGRIAGGVIMTLGIALLGVLAGSLASFFRIAPTSSSSAPPETESTEGSTTSPDATSGEMSEGPPSLDDADLSALRKEVVDLRSEIRELTKLLNHSTEAPASVKAADES